MHLLQRAHVDDDAAADLRLSERLMTLTARDDLQAEATREADDARDVALRAGPQHCDRLFVDDPTVVVRVFRARCGIDDSSPSSCGRFVNGALAPGLENPASSEPAVMAARLRRENWEAWLSVIDQ